MLIKDTATMSLILASRAGPLPHADTGTTAVFVNEIDASPLQRRSNCVDGFR